ncbi:MAG: DUF882 domain-containing protein [Rhizobiaceae bacterium]
MVWFVRHYRGSLAAIPSKALAFVLLALAALLFAAPGASAETRTLKLYFVHTKEKAEITFKRNGRYDAEGLREINNFLRDWRRNEPTKMDPRLLDLVWEAYRATGSREYINVVSAYRSPATNGMLRSRSKGVAKKSQHMLGRAMDFYIPGVKLKTLREIGLKMQGGGVGYYPTSGSPFVHFDVGNVRHWPKMSRKELVAVFPNGKTLHVPSDGKPLPGFDQALAAYKKRGGGGAAVALASAVGDGGGKKKRSGGLLAAFFGGGADEEEESGGTVVAAVDPEEAAPQPKAAVGGKAAVRAGADSGGIRILSPAEAKRVELQPIAEEVVETPETLIAALPARDIPMPEFAPRPKVDVGATDAGAPLVDLSAVAAKPLVDLGQPAAEPQAVAMIDGKAVPVPTGRPAFNAAKDLGKTDDSDAAMLLALASTDTTGPDLGGVPMPTGRPAAEIAAAAPVEVAALALPEDGPFPASPEEILPEMRGTEGGVQPATMRAALFGGGETPVEALGNPVRTTKKSGRPSASDSKPDRKVKVVEAQPIDARWALDTDYVASNTRKSSAPSYAYNAVRTAPREVYTAGFQAGGQVDATRFSGKSVTFLSVARFN